MWKWIAVLVVLGGAVVVAGEVHVVTGTGAPKLRTKERWGLRDTFVDVNDYIGRSMLDVLRPGIDDALRSGQESPLLQHQGEVLLALIRCGVLANPTRDAPGRR